MSHSSSNLVLDFTGDIQNIGWEAIDDRIMGGCSLSRPDYLQGIGLRFSGTVSLDNNGGFASIRSSMGCFDLSSYSGMKIRVCGDGRTYKLSLRTDLYYDGISYQAPFATKTGVWQEINLPFDAFAPTHHGLKLTTVPAMEPSQVKSFGLFIADRQAGPFKLDIAWLGGF
jgi:monofunctional biosynthetic peptidoglycan transglycosylase